MILKLKKILFESNHIMQIYGVLQDTLLLFNYTDTEINHMLACKPVNLLVCHVMFLDSSHLEKN